MEFHKKLTICLLASLFPMMSQAIDYTNPRDLAALEAFVWAHKSQAKAAKVSLTESTAINGMTAWTKEMTEKYNHTRTIINKRLGDLEDWWKMLGMATNTGIKAIDAAEEVKDFAVFINNNIGKHPLVAMYGYQTISQLKREVSSIAQLMADYGLSQTNILKATMAEKYRMLNMVDNAVFRVRQIISRNMYLCQRLVHSNSILYTIEAIVAADPSKEIADGLIARWTENCNELK